MDQSYFKQKLSDFVRSQMSDVLTNGLRGIEKEGLRVNQQGELSQQAHPRALGSKLTHASITTDYSEALLELITPALRDLQAVHASLHDLHHFVYQTLASQNEYIWSASMPSILPDEANIPIADYGTSNAGQFKTIYRRGLAHRYHRMMQCIAGIHYNFSLSTAFWEKWAQLQAEPVDDLQSFISDQYFHLIRNFKRYSWLLIYLFGASPALDRSFEQGDQVLGLQVFDEKTLYLLNATSLRLSDLGYTNTTVQSAIKVKYENLSEYIAGLSAAVNQVYPPYQAIGLKQNNEWIQVNTNILQIENEFYSTIRPKRTLDQESRALDALKKGGVQYIEIRCMDIDPFDALGISVQTCQFLDAFLLFCLLQESPALTDDCLKEMTSNICLVTRQGRLPNLSLQLQGQTRLLADWANELLDQIQATAQLWDQAYQSDAFVDSVEQQRPKIQDASLTPSAKVLAQMQSQQLSFSAFTLRQSKQHAAHFTKPLSARTQQSFQQQAVHSLAEQAALEREQGETLDEFMLRFQHYG